MEIINTNKRISMLRTDVLTIGVFKGEKYSGAFKDVDGALGGVLKRISKEEGFEGEQGKSVMVNSTFGKIGAAKVLLVGLGPKSELSADTLRKAGRLAAGALGGHAGEEISFSPVFSEVRGGIAALTEGIIEGSYNFDKYKTGDRPKKDIKKVVLVSRRLKESTLKEEVSYARVISQSTI